MIYIYIIFNICTWIVCSLVGQLSVFNMKPLECDGAHV